ncbi:hypothetical protein MalM25_25750 [Planctomycetes bacterium MalM25]|nr:hypothetical protein MalM25_25750 [Planctomycetes bacterium MalM25]
MSMGPLGGIVGSVAGSPLSQTKGTSEERSAREAAAQDKADELDLRAEKSSGVGQAEGDSEASDRDADGRRLWERTDEPEKASEEEQAPAEAAPPPGDDDNRLDLIA